MGESSTFPIPHRKRWMIDHGLEGPRTTCKTELGKKGERCFQQGNEGESSKHRIVATTEAAKLTAALARVIQGLGARQHETFVTASIRGNPRGG